MNAFRRVRRLVGGLAGPSEHRHVLRAVAIVGGMTFAVKVVALGKDMLVARQYGTSAELDAFYIALLLPSYSVTLIAGSAHSAFVPTLISVGEHRSKAAAQLFLRRFTSLQVVIYCGLCALLALSTPWSIPALGSGFAADILGLTRTSFLVLIPIAALGGLAILWMGVLHAVGKFPLSAGAPAVISLSTAAFVLLYGSAWGIWALVIGTLVGYGLQLAIVGAGLVHQHMAPLPAWRFWDADIAATMREVAPRMGGAFLMGATTLVDQAMAAMLAPGSVASLNFALKVPAVLLGIIAGALGTAVFPHFSRLVAKGDWAAIRDTVRTYTGLTILGTVPLVAGLVYFSAPVVAVLFQRGSFTNADTALVASIQALYLLQVPFYTLAIMLDRLAGALRRNALSMQVAGFALVANVVLNYLFMRWIGVAGIALSTSAVYAMVCAMLWLGLRGAMARPAES